MGKRKQGVCRICKKRPPWKYKNCPPRVCKRCYHHHVWVSPVNSRQSLTTENVVRDDDQRHTPFNLDESYGLSSEPDVSYLPESPTPAGADTWNARMQDCEQ